MQVPIKKTQILLILYGLLMAYLLLNTGLFSDEFETTFTENKQYYLDVPMLYITHFIWYPTFDINNQLTLNMLKIFYVFLSFYLVSKFFTIYLNEEQAMLASFLFIFFPSHDATTYWFMGQYLTLSFAFYLFAFYLAYNNRLVKSFAMGLTASFICYGSTPLAIGLCVLFLLNKNFKKALVLIVPNVIYAVYFIPVNILMRMGSPRIVEKFSIGAVFKQFLLQALTFIDALLGPSMWIKVYYAFSQLSAITIIIGVIIIFAIYKIRNISRYDVKFIKSFAVMIILSFVMFAATGRYPQMAFNLGDRVTIYGSLLIVYLLVALPMPKVVRKLIITLLVFSIVGISNHWKAWSVHQNVVMHKIENNEDLRNYKDSRTIYVSGNQYSMYGSMSHIEFLSEGCVSAFIFKYNFGRWMPVDTINKHFIYTDGYLEDIKYGGKTKVDDYINVYDSENDILFMLKAQDINGYIDSLPQENRHWIQLKQFKSARNVAMKLMPRLNYVLK